MPQQFNLILTNRWKATVLVLAIIVTFIPLMVGALEVFFNHNHIIGALAIVLCIATFIFLPERIAFSRRAVVVVIDDTGMSVQYEAAGPVCRINFMDIASYSTGVDFDFTVRPRTGQLLQLHLNRKLHPQGLGPMLAMQQYFQWAVADYQRQHPNQPTIRDLGFFDRPVAVVLLLLFAGLGAWLGWRAFQPFASEGTWGGLLLSGLLFAIYASVWWHHRAQSR